MKQTGSISAAQEIMIEFAKLTGLAPAGTSPTRYLWTDAFAVCNFLGLYQETGDAEFRNLALELVDQVHQVLGRHRPDDRRTGWISGLDEGEGKLHPTRGGLRIGKKLKERKPTDPLNERLEWDRDGQYYHYLTKWMHALNRVTRVTGDFVYNRWAVELAQAAHGRFVHPSSSGRQKRMYWKLSIDLSYPLVSSMGHHDSLDGFVTYCQLQATAREDRDRSVPDLTAEIADMAAICQGKSWVTDDPLGIGGLLFDASMVGQLMAGRHFDETDLLAILLDDSLPGLESYAGQHGLKLPPEYRLPFRELGLSIGLKALERLRGLIKENPGLLHKDHGSDASLEGLRQYVPLEKIIEGFWLQAQHRESESWVAHRDINMVMLATTLAPDGYLSL